jgi:hypothetical protein
MKLSDKPLDPEAERELDAVDAALAGRAVAPDFAGWGELTELLQDQRPEADPAWCAELDARAASRFRPEGGGSWHDALDRLKAMPPRRIAGPAGALATLAIVVVVAASALSGGGSDSTDSASLQPIPAKSDEALSGPAPTSPGAESAGDAAAATVAPDSKYLSASRDQGKLSPGTEQRQVDRDVSMRLSTRPDAVRDVSDDVITIARSLDGIVVSSQVSESGNHSTATLELTIPSKNLDVAIDRLRDLAHVDSLNETTADITHPYVTAQEDLRDAQAERRSLLDALANASTASEAESLRLQIDDARRRISQAQARFENIARQARLSTVSVQVVADPDAPAADDGRSLGDWVDDALSVLRDVAGVLLITAAIAVPLAMIAAVAWLLVSRLRRRRRERALDA